MQGRCLFEDTARELGPVSVPFEGCVSERKEYLSAVSQLPWCFLGNGAVFGLCLSDVISESHARGRQR